MAQHCFKNEYFDSLLQSCIPCHLRCSSKPPFSCQSYCNESPVQVSDRIIWIGLGTGLILTFTVFILMVLFKRKRPKLSKEELKNADSNSFTHGGEYVIPQIDPLKSMGLLENVLHNMESVVELNVILKADTENSVNTDIIGDSLESETSLMYSVEECTCVDYGFVKLQTGLDTSFPLPATDEGATVLVTTKTSEYCSYIPDAMTTHS